MRTYGRLTLKRGQWHIDAEPHVFMRLKRIFGKVDRRKAGTLQVSHSPETCRDLVWVLERYPLSVDETSDAALHAGARQHHETILRLEQIIDPNYQPQTFAMALPPRSYQAKEAEIYLANRSLLIADDVGLGKTAAAICSLTDPRTLPAVVVTLTHLPRQWQDEIAKFAPELHTHIIKKGTPYELPTFMGARPDVVIINYHKLSGWANVLRAYAKSIVFDEVQELRRSESARYTAAKVLTSALDYRLGLSATPVYNYGGEIFNVLDILKPGCLGTWNEFKQEWCSDSYDDRKVTLKNPKAFGSYAREAFLMIRHTREEVGRELPPIIRIPHRIDSDHEALDRVEDSAAELAKIILAQHETEKGAKWHASEQLTVMLRQATGIAKAPYVADFVRMLVESGERVVLGGWHREVYAIWQAKLKDLKPLMYTGSETPAQKEAAKNAFVRGESPILILSLRSGAGLNGLQEVASTVVFGELDWSPAVEDQFIGRVHRDGQARSVVVYFLHSEDGADPLIVEIRGLKREQAEGIRNPDRELFEKIDAVDPDRAKRLAEFYLKKLGRPLPEGQEAQVA